MRVRSIQVHDREVAAAAGGQRVALNLTGIDRDEVDRGQWIVKDPAIEPTYLADVRLTLLSDAPGPLPRVSRNRVDHGTAEILAKVVLADRESLEPGESCYAQMRFEEQVLVYPGDQFILRSVTPVSTIGGGRVIDPAPHKHSTGPRWHDRLTLLEQGPPDAIAALLLQESFPLNLTRGGLEVSPYLWQFAAGKIRAAIADLTADGRAVVGDRAVAATGPRRRPTPRRRPPGRGDGHPDGAATPKGAAPGANVRLFHGPSLLALTDAALATLRAKAEKDALNPYLTLGELRRDLAGGEKTPALDAALGTSAGRRSGGPDRTRIPAGPGRRWQRAARRARPSSACCSSSWSRARMRPAPPRHRA